jgi:hypothetical protein
MHMNGDKMNQTYIHTNTDAGDLIDSTPEDAGIIPFADECLPGSGAPIERDDDAMPKAEHDSAEEAFGAFARRESVVDRELGLGRQRSQRRGKYACPCCGEGASRVMRVRISQQPGWSAVCAVCAATLLAKVPGTIVGGMVRPTRRRRKGAPGSVAHGFRRPDQGGYRRAG